MHTESPRAGHVRQRFQGAARNNDHLLSTVSESGACAAGLGCQYHVFFDRPRLVRSGVLSMYRGHPATLHGQRARRVGHPAKGGSRGHDRNQSGAEWTQSGGTGKGDAAEEGGVRVCWLPNVFNVATLRCASGDDEGGEGEGRAGGERQRGGWDGLLAAALAQHERAAALEERVCRIMGDLRGSGDADRYVSLQGVGGFIHNRCGAGLCHCIGRRGCVREVS